MDSDSPRAKNTSQGETKDRMMVIYGKDYAGEDQPVTLGFGGNSDLVRLFFRQLAVLCGPFVLVRDGDRPEIIGLDPDQDQLAEGMA